MKYKKFSGGNWKVGKHGDCVVTDLASAYRDDRDRAESMEYYGGALVCESARMSDAAFIATAPAMFNALVAVDAYFVKLQASCALTNRDEAAWGLVSKVLTSLKK